MSHFMHVTCMENVRNPCMLHETCLYINIITCMFCCACKLMKFAWNMHVTCTLFPVGLAFIYSCMIGQVRYTLLSLLYKDEKLSVRLSALFWHARSSIVSPRINARLARYEAPVLEEHKDFLKWFYAQPFAVYVALNTRV